MIFDPTLAWRVLPILLEGLGVTVLATLGGMALAATLGLILAVLRGARTRLLAWPAAAFIEFVRGTPLLVQLYFLFYALPDLGLALPPLATGIVGLGLHYAAYCAEVYRAGIEGLPQGQWDAAAAINLAPWPTWRDVILPQALPPILPALGNYFVAMFKDTPLLSAITVLEMLQRAKILGAETFRYVEPLTLVGLLFLVLSLAAAALVARLERRLAPPGGTA